METSQKSVVFREIEEETAENPAEAASYRGNGGVKRALMANAHEVFK